MKFPEIVDATQGIGFTAPIRGRHLYRCILDRRAAKCLELGFAHGVGSAYISGALHEQGRGRLIAIDRPAAKLRVPNAEALLDRLRLSPFVELRHHEVSYTWALLDLLREGHAGTFEFCFIDGAHRLETDGLAFFLVDRLMAPGGVIVFDDLDWTAATSPTVQDAPTTRAEPELERTTAQIRLLFNEIVRCHGAYETFERDGMGFAIKRSARPLRPLIICNFDYVLGGGEVGAVALAEDLAALGHHPILAIPGSGGLGADLQGVERVTLPLEPQQTASALADLSADVVHVTSVRMLRRVATSGLTTPVVFHAITPESLEPEDDWLHRADAVICNSFATAERFAGRAETSVIYNGVRTPEPQSPSVFEPNTIAILGGTCLRKGQLDALPALQEVLERRPEMKVAFVGRMSGPVARVLRDACFSSEGRMKMLGFVPDIARHLHALRLLLVPSRSEGFGRVAVEAALSGTPVLATRVGGLVEALQDLDDPWLSNDPSRWADRILSELDEPRHTKDQLIAAGRRFSPARFNELIVGVYRSLTFKEADRG